MLHIFAGDVDIKPCPEEEDTGSTESFPCTTSYQNSHDFTAFLYPCYGTATICKRDKLY